MRDPCGPRIRLMRRDGPVQRTGGAVVELAICLPLLALVVLGTIQICNLIHVTESLEVASYEAARVICKGESFRTSALERANQILASRSVTNATIQILPSNLNVISLGAPVEVTITASVPTGMFGTRALSGRTTMFKERE